MSQNVNTIYQDLVSQVLLWGEHREDRTGTGTRALFGLHAVYPLWSNFPLLTSKRIPFKLVTAELLWFLSGSTNNNELKDLGCNIWDEWAKPDGELGPIYGYQWRNFGGVDQISELIHNIKTNPYSRRHIVSAWNPADLPDMALPPCHALFQFYVTAQGRLDCNLYQRSADLFLGVPFNIASYALLTCMIAHVCGLKPGRFIHSIGDAHVYNNHSSQFKEQFSRPLVEEKPELWLNPEIKNIFDFKMEDVRIENYHPHPTIKGEVSV